MQQPTLQEVWARGVGYGFAMATGGTMLSPAQMRQANLAFNIMMEIGEDALEHLKKGTGVIKDA